MQFKFGTNRLLDPRNASDVSLCSCAAACCGAGQRTMAVVASRSKGVVNLIGYTHFPQYCDLMLQRTVVGFTCISSL